MSKSEDTELQKAVRAAYRLGHCDARWTLYSAIIADEELSDSTEEENRRRDKTLVLAALGYEGVKGMHKVRDRVRHIEKNIHGHVMEVVNRTGQIVYRIDWQGVECGDNFTWHSASELDTKGNCPACDMGNKPKLVSMKRV